MTYIARATEAPYIGCISIYDSADDLTDSRYACELYHPLDILIMCVNHLIQRNIT